MDPQWYTVVLAVFVSQMLAISGAIEHHRVARDEAAGLGAILETAKDVTNPEKIKDTIDLMTNVLLGDQKFLGLGRKRRDLYSPSALVRVEDDVDALDSEEVNWRLAHVPGETAKSGAETSGISTPPDAPSVRKRRAAQMSFPSSMTPGGTDPEEYKQKAKDMMEQGEQASGMNPPPNMPSFPGSERKRRAAQMPSPPSMTPGGMTPPSSTSDGMTPPSSMPNGMTPPSSMPNGVTPPSSMPNGVTPPSSMPNGMTPPSGITPPSRVPSDKKRKRRQSMEDMTEETQTKHSKHTKRGGKGKGKGKNKISTTTPAIP